MDMEEAYADSIDGAYDEGGLCECGHMQGQHYVEQDTNAEVCGVGSCGCCGFTDVEEFEGDDEQQ